MLGVGSERGNEFHRSSWRQNGVHWPFLGSATNSSLTGCRKGSLEAYLIYTVYCRSQPMNKLKYSISQTNLVPILRPRDGGRGWREWDSNQEPRFAVHSAASFGCCLYARLRAQSDCTMTRITGTLLSSSSRTGQPSAHARFGTLVFATLTAKGTSVIWQSSQIIRTMLKL